MSINVEEEFLAQVKCLNKNCGKVLPLRVKIYDGKISARCSKGCKGVTIEWFMKGKLVFATVIPEKRTSGKVMGTFLGLQKGGDILSVVAI